MDKTQIVSLMLLVALVLGLVLDGTRAFSDPPADNEVQAPSGESQRESAPERVPAQPGWDPASRHGHRFA